MEEGCRVRPGDKGFTLTYIIAPWLLWPFAFILLSEHFITGMTIATAILGGLTLWKFGLLLDRKLDRRKLLVIIVYTIILFLAFAGGDKLVDILGLNQGVTQVYRSVGRSPMLILPLAWIGVWEEVYWRGGLQEKIIVERLGLPWVYSAIPYSLVHISTGNPVLVAAALVVGIVLGHEAHHYGITASSITHVSWLYLVLILIPFS
ncbi:MAG: CPBP family glutamic-type intramembrane protease [Desulfurococcales archaeon]|nr:CPBP family glutamic-type intramembrane protease [Desulfurococcales archaeon]